MHSRVHVTRKARLFSILLILILGITLVFASTAFAASTRSFTTTLTGAAEVPGPGDPDGSGVAKIRLNPGDGEVCFKLSVSDIVLPTIGAHIHVGTEDVAGPVVVGLTPPGESGTSSGCVSADPALIRAIGQNPAGYYVNVHTTDFPAGAVRGQLP
jgi:CHRD domain